MIEAGVVFALVALLAGIGVLVPVMPGSLIVQAGAWMIGAGAVFGLPSGLWYHVKLRAALLRCDALPDRWWIRPVALHDQVPGPERSGVLRWFLVGGLGFLAIVLGAFLVAAGVLLEAYRSGAL